MKCKAQAGLALVGGYLLGRTKKFKLALMVGGLAAGRGLSTNPSALLKQGGDVLRSNSELNKLVEQARGGLMDAGKAAMIAAASSRLDAVSGRLSDRASSLGSAVPSRGGKASDDDEDVEDESPAEVEDVADDEETEDDTESGTRRARSARRSTRDRDGSSAPKRSAPKRRSNGRSTERARAGARRGEDDG